MSYNEDLQSNNAELQAILDAVNSLPNASGGSGGGGELPLVFSTTLTEATTEIKLTQINGSAFSFSKWKLILRIPDGLAKAFPVYIYPLGEKNYQTSFTLNTTAGTDPGLYQLLVIEPLNSSYVTGHFYKYSGSADNRDLIDNLASPFCTEILVTTYSSTDLLPVGTLLEVYGR
jgi:hypothetical protein